MEHEETGCEPAGAPIQCVNNCGFFGTAATENMCSKCHRDFVMKQQQAKLAASSITSIITGTGSSKKEPVVSGKMDAAVGAAEIKTITAQPSNASVSDLQAGASKTKEGPNRCHACRKRVGLLGFSCRCGSLFCTTHRHSDQHNCQFDYRTAAKDAIAKANPVVKAEKLNKI